MNGLLIRFYYDKLLLILKLLLAQTSTGEGYDVESSVNFLRLFPMGVFLELRIENKQIMILDLLKT